MQQRERRAWPRIRKQLRVLISDPADALDYFSVGWIVDWSQGGVCLTSRREGIQTGDLLMVQSASGHAQLPWITVKVNNLRGKASRTELGCQFVERQGWNKMLVLG